MYQKRNFDDFIAAYMDYTKNHESTRKLHLWTAISIIAAAMERKVWMDRGYYTLYPNLYVFIIARSGLVKKSTSTSIGVDLLKSLSDIRVMSDRLTQASLVKQLHSAYKPFEIQEKIIKQSPLFAYASELAVFMGEVYGSITELLTTFYDCQPNDPDKPWVYKAKHEEQEKIFGPCLNILGASTKEWLTKCIPDSEMEGGFTSRCIFVVENNGPDKLVAWPEIPQHVKGMKTLLLDDLDRIFNLAGEVRVHSKTKRRFTEWYEYHMNEIVKKNTDNRLSGYYSRKGDMILKLAMVRAVSLSDELVVMPEHLDWAGKQLEEIEPDMMDAFISRRRGAKCEPQSPEQETITPHKILTWLKMQDKPVPQHEIAKQFDTLSEQVVGRMLQQLLEMNEIDFDYTDGPCFKAADKIDKQMNSF